MTVNWYQKTKHLPGVREKHRAKAKEWRDSHPGINMKYYYTSKRRDPRLWLIKQAKQRAKKKGLNFTITKDHIVIPEFCCYLGCKLNVAYEPGFHWDSPSIDRIDSALGYTPDNIQIISSQANRMKWDATQEQLIAFAKGVLEKEVALAH